MSTATSTKTPRTLIAAATAVTSGTPQRGGVDLRTAFGGVLTIKLANGATAPTTAPTVNVLVAHYAGATPALGPRGADWKTWLTLSGDTTNSSVNEFAIDIPQGVMHLAVEVVNNSATGSMTGEAYLSELTSIANA